MTLYRWQNLSRNCQLAEKEDRPTMYCSQGCRWCQEICWKRRCCCHWILQGKFATLPVHGQRSIAGLGLFSKKNLVVTDKNAGNHDYTKLSGWYLAAGCDLLFNFWLEMKVGNNVQGCYHSTIIHSWTNMMLSTSRL